MTSPPMSASALRAAVRDLHETSPWPGLRKALGLGALVLALAGVALSASSLAVCVAATLAAALAYAVLVYLSHDAAHHALTGVRWLDDGIGRAIGLPLFTPFATFRELHRMHHKMVGASIEDPERRYYTRDEY